MLHGTTFCEHASGCSHNAVMLQVHARGSADAPSFPEPSEGAWLTAYVTSSRSHCPRGATSIALTPRTGRCKHPTPRAMPERHVAHVPLRPHIRRSNAPESVQPFPYHSSSAPPLYRRDVDHPSGLQPTSLHLLRCNRACFASTSHRCVPYLEPQYYPRSQVSAIYGNVTAIRFRPAMTYYMLLCLIHRASRASSESWT